MELRVLGPVEVRVGGTAVPLGGGKSLVVLAGLLLYANKVVMPAQLGHWLWDGDGPANPRAAVQTHVARLRRAVGAAVPITTDHGGYRAVVAEPTFDLAVFRQRRAAAAQAGADGDHARAAALYADALALWHGPALATVESAALRREEAPTLAQLHLQTQQDWAAATIAAGRPVAAIPLLTGLVDQDPLREPCVELLMLALHRSGRRTDALEVYQRTAASLADQLGLDPGQALADLYVAILNDESAHPAAPVVPAPARGPVPHQLPAPVPHFTGRVAELAEFERLTSSARARAVIVDGMGGAGKTSFAVHCANRLAPDFPDGQYFVDLRGFGGEAPVDPATALEDLLWASGVRGQDLPASLDARCALWRERTSGRRVLVVLDNARSPAQVRPLFPGDGGLTLVTSRRRLGSLGVHEGAHRIALGALPEPDALAVLSNVVGPAAIEAAPEAAVELVRACAHLPLALRIIGERIRQRPTALPEVVAELSRERGPLAALVVDDEDDTDLRAVFARSLDVLSPDATRLFRRLGLHPGRFLDVDIATVLGGQDRVRTTKLLGELTTANLLEQRAHDRWSFHDLLRDFAAAECERTESSDTRDALLDRLVDWYTATAYNAARVSRPFRRFDLLAIPDGVDAPEFPVHRDAMAWLRAHETNVVALVRWAGGHGRPVAAWQLPFLMMVLFIANSRFDVWQETYEIGLAAARGIPNRQAEAVMLSGLGTMHALAGRFEPALARLRESFAINQELGDPEGQLRAAFNLGLQCNSAGRPREAKGHLLHAVDMARQLGLVSLEADSLEQLSRTYALLGDCSSALRLAEESLALWDKLGEHLQRMYALVSRGHARTRLGDHAGGIADYRTAIALFEQADEHLDVALACEGLGDAYAAIGDTENAVQAWRHAHAVLAQLNHPATAALAAKIAGTGGATTTPHGTG